MDAFKKLEAQYRRWLDKPGDRIELVKRESARPLKGEDLYVKIHAQYHDGDSSTPDWRIEKALDAGAKILAVPSVLRRKTANDGSFDYEVRVYVGDMIGVNSLNTVIRSTNPVVQKALNMRAARNAAGVRGDERKNDATNSSGDKIKITIISITDKGLQTFEMNVDLDGLERWMRATGLEDKYQGVLKQLATMGVRNVPLAAMSKIVISVV